MITRKIDQTWAHSFSTYAKFSENLTFLTPICTHSCAYQGAKNFSFSANFAYVVDDVGFVKFILFLIFKWLAGQKETYSMRFINHCSVVPFICSPSIWNRWVALFYKCRLMVKEATRRNSQNIMLDNIPLSLWIASYSKLVGWITRRNSQNIMLWLNYCLRKADLLKPKPHSCWFYTCLVTWEFRHYFH